MSYLDNLYNPSSDTEIINEFGDSRIGQHALSRLQDKSKMRLWGNAKEFGKRAATGTPNGGLIEKLHRDVSLQDKLKNKIGIGGAGPLIARKGVEQGYYSGLRKNFVPAKEALSRAHKIGQNAW